MTSEQVDKLITFGQMALEQGWYDQAREYFEQALALDATNREATKGLARANEVLSRKAAVEPIQVKPVKQSALRSLFGFDWQGSSAHLLLLSKFLSPRKSAGFSKTDDWKTVLRETPKKAIKRFLDEGMIERASLAGLLAYKYKVSDLKKMLKQRGLPVSGRKADLIERLVQADPNGMKRATHGLTVLQCSEQGRAIAEQFLANEKEKRARVEQQVLNALRRRKFKEACLMVASFEAEQVFPRGLSIKWRHYNPTRDVAMLRTIFVSRLKILAHLNDKELDQLRIAAGMMHLWGTSAAKEWLPPDFETELAMDSDAAVRMLGSYVSHQINMAEYRQSRVIKAVEIYNCNDSSVCDACRKLARRKYKLNKVPELPYEKCTSEMGCRCWVVPVVE